jgi:hypothetical protein
MDNDDRWTYDSVRRRLKMVIENMPARRAEIYSDQLLKNLTEDLIQIREGLRFLEREGERGKGESRSCPS